MWYEFDYEPAGLMNFEFVLQITKLDSEDGKYYIVLFFEGFTSKGLRYKDKETRDSEYEKIKEKLIWTGCSL